MVGLGGLFFPQALGVGYDTIHALLRGDVATQTLLGVLLVKSTIWAVSLGSGTSGGVLAPLLMMGGALGGLEATVLPDGGAGFWPLVSMGAIMGGTMRSPLTGVVFALELTHDVNMLLPLLCATAVAHGFTVLVMRRSILTEKVSRRGYHLTREYAIDPLEILFVREAMRTSVLTIAADTLLRDLANSFHTERNRRRQGLYPVLERDGRLVGVLTRTDILTLPEGGAAAHQRVRDIARRRPVVAHPDEPLRAVVYRMAETGLTRMPVVDRADPGRLMGLITLGDLLKARLRNLEEERRRERVLHVRQFMPLRTRRLLEEGADARGAAAG